MMNRAIENTAVIVVAGGRSVRFGGGPPKTLADLNGKSVLARSLAAFCGRVAYAVVVTPEGLEAEMAAIARTSVPDARVVTGGKRRQDSVEAGFRALDPSIRWVLVHDAARPLVDSETVDAVLAATRRTGAAVPVLPVHATVKTVDEEGMVVRTVPRQNLRLAQTPQGFRRDLLEEGFRALAGCEDVFTDEAALLESIGVQVMTVPGKTSNLKITTPEDLAWASAWLTATPSGGAS